MASSSVHASNPSTPLMEDTNSFLFQYEGKSVFVEDPIAVLQAEDEPGIKFHFSAAKKSESFINQDEIGNLYVLLSYIYNDFNAIILHFSVCLRFQQADEDWGCNNSRGEHGAVIH
jgi:hypothetical protein